MVAVIVAVPEQVAVPLARLAVVGAPVAPYPVFVTTNTAPAQLPEVTKVTVTDALVRPLLKVPKLQVPTPDMVPPEANIIDASPEGANPNAPRLKELVVPLVVVGKKPEKPPTNCPLAEAETMPLRRTATS
jgi:hypothetical protein